MPYIKQEQREYFNELLEKLKHSSLSGPGELNFLFTMIIKQYLETRPFNYQAINDIVGALDCCKTEFYLRKALPYEESKIEDNGDVW